MIRSKFDKNVNELIYKSINEKGITLTELSKITKISYPTLKGYFTKWVPIRWNKFISICMGANLNVSKLLKEFDKIEIGGTCLNDNQSRKTKDPNEI